MFQSHTTTCGPARSRLVALLIAALPMLAALAIPGRANAISWSVNAGSYVYGGYPSLAVDGSSNVHESIRLSATGVVGHLYYRKWTAAGWGSLQPVRSSANHYNSSVATDAAGNPFIAYSEGPVNNNGVFMFASRVNNAWSSVPAATQCATTSTITLRVDASGKPHAAFSTYATLSPSTFTMNYLSKDAGGQWFSEPLSAGVASQYSSLALDAAGVPCVTYSLNNGDMVYRKRTNGVWSTSEVVDNTSDFIVGSMVLNSAGEPCVSYYDVVAKDLRVAVRNGGTWTRTTLDATGDVGASSSIGLLGDGRLQITYWDRDAWDIKCATEKVDGSWDVRLVDPTPVLPSAGSWPQQVAMVNAGFETRIAYFGGNFAPSRTYYSVGNYAGPTASANLTAAFGRTTWVTSWLAPAGAVSYELRMASAPITTEAAWAAATPVTSGATIAGTPLCRDAQDQAGCSPFQFAVRHVDAQGMRSPLGNNAGGSTRCSGSTEVLCEDPNALLARGPERGGAVDFSAPLPNPARQSSLLRFSIPSALAGANARLGIYDMQGRLVRTLVDGPVVAGDASARWDLNSEAGARVAPGLYFARLVVGANAQTRTVLVTR